MIQDSSTICWNEAGKELCNIAQTNDFRMFFIMPYTLNQLGDVNGKEVLDLGCGEGGYSRALAHEGAKVTSIDCAIDPINFAIKKAAEEGLIIRHLVRNSNDLYDVENNSFEIILCSMMLMDCEDFLGTIKEISRVLKPGGKLFVSVLHPCFNAKNIKWSGGDDDPSVVVEDYFSPKEWGASIAGINSPIIFRHRTLQEYMKGFIQNNLRLVDLNEPLPTNEQVKKSSRIGRLLKIPMFLFMEFTK